MDPEALIGMVLGTCTLQRLIGQGGMGAVFLALQSRPQRQVAVKVLLPVTPLTAKQREAFLERFRRETDAAASLEHPNIVPVHEYGERDGLAYLVMPYISGGTLRDELEREGQMPFAKIVGYLDQIAAALEVAHERGVVHRDIKPANILITPEKRLLLTDFGLVKIVAEGQAPQARLTGIGIPMGTPEYMAPEQVVGADVDARADIYSLGCILYHMVTGSAPFKGEMPMQVAMQHLHMPPPMPRTLRPDLPATAEQVILQALAKSPADRYLHAQDLANAFRIALTVAGMLPGDSGNGAISSDNGIEIRSFTPRGLFDPVWQNNAPHPGGQNQYVHASPAVSMGAMSGHEQNTPARTDIAAQTNTMSPAFTGSYPPRSVHTPLPMGTPASPAHTPLPQIGQVQNYAASPQPQAMYSVSPQPQAIYSVNASEPYGVANMPQGLTASPLAANIGQGATGLSPAPIQDQPTMANRVQTGMLTNGPAVTRILIGPEGAGGGRDGQSMTGVLSPIGDPAGQGTTSMMRLPQPMRVVQVPVAGQPGRYLTGLLPMLPPTPPDAAEPDPVPPFTAGSTSESLKSRLRQHMKAVILVGLLLCIVFGSCAFWLIQTHTGQMAVDQGIGLSGTPDAAATAAAQVTATAQANTILTDALNENIHDWRVADRGSQIFAFEGGAYHIANNDTYAAIALLPDEVPPTSFVYTLSMAEIRGDDTSMANQFGLIIRYNTVQRRGNVSSTFYFFDVASARIGGQYQFWKYDGSYGPDVDPWTELWASPLGRDYHFGHGVRNTNTLKIIVNGSKFSFVVNGKLLGLAMDNSLTGGQVGMLVNLKGTEVAFSNLMLTYH